MEAAMQQRQIVANRPREKAKTLSLPAIPRDR